MAQPKHSKKQNLKDYSLWKNNRLLFPILDIELTERCHYNCIHCSINQPLNDANIRDKELSADSLKRILREAADFGCIHVRFTGGEPLIKENFRELYKFSRELGFGVLVFTNGSLINQELVDLFLEIPPLEKIEVSFYGMKKQSYEAVTRTPGSFERARKGIDLLLKNKIPFVVKGAFLPPNKKELPLFDSWAKQIPWMEDVPPLSLFLNLRHRHDSMNKNKSIKKLRISPEESLAVLTRNEPRFSEDMKIYCSQLMHPQGDRLFTCGAGKSSATLDPYGYLYPCSLVKHPSTAFDLKKGSLKQAFLEFFPALREKKAKNPDYLDRCAQCFLKGLCEMCPGRSWLEHGTLDTPVDYFCEIAHAQARYLGYIDKHEKGWEVKDWRDRIEQNKPHPKNSDKK